MSGSYIMPPRITFYNGKGIIYYNYNNNIMPTCSGLSLSVSLTSIVGDDDDGELFGFGFILDLSSAFLLYKFASSFNDPTVMNVFMIVSVNKLDKFKPVVER